MSDDTYSEAAPDEDRTLPEGRWTFDAEVTSVFENMLARSIPDYETMRGLVRDLGFRFRKPGMTIVDLGCSRGDALAPFVDRYGTDNAYVGVDVSEPMLMASQARFTANPLVFIEACDLRKDYPSFRSMSERLRERWGALPPEEATHHEAVRFGWAYGGRAEYACVTLAVLVLQFVPIEYRQSILRAAYDATARDGALIVVEKVLGSDGAMDRVLTEHYYALKAQNGYTVEEIERKRLSLEGVLVPVSIAENERMLRAAGFAHVEQFWRFLNFSGWLAVR